MRFEAMAIVFGVDLRGRIETDRRPKRFGDFFLGCHFSSSGKRVGDFLVAKKCYFSSAAKAKTGFTKMAPNAPRSSGKGFL